MPKQSLSPLLGDEADLYAEHAQVLLRHVRGVVRTSDEIVEDACAAAWTILLRRQPDRGHTLFGWLRVVAIREAIRMDRAARALSSYEAVIAAAEYEDSEAAVGKERPRPQPALSDDSTIRAREALRELARLDERPRRILALHVAGYSYDEIGELTGDTVRTVDRQMRRARQRVRWPQR
jgi:RNA polymerase sigma factor (sigma-70 family)